MKPVVYLETTIPSYLVSRPSRDLVVAAHQQVTREWWANRRSEFDLVISRFVLDEVSQGDTVAASQRLAILKDIPQLTINEDVLVMTDAILNTGLIPHRALRDAGHIAVSAVNGVDFLLTWNCSHIANGPVIVAVRELCEEMGFECPIICTPDTLLEPMP